MTPTTVQALTGYQPMIEEHDRAAATLIRAGCHMDGADIAARAIEEAESATAADLLESICDTAWRIERHTERTDPAAVAVWRLEITIKRDAAARLPRSVHMASKWEAINAANAALQHPIIAAGRIR